jgi:hypothetical protein
VLSQSTDTRLRARRFNPSTAITHLPPGGGQQVSQS